MDEACGYPGRATTELHRVVQVSVQSNRLRKIETIAERLHLIINAQRPGHHLAQARSAINGTGARLTQC